MLSKDTASPVRDQGETRSHMNIVIACEILPPDIGGPATFVPRLVLALVTQGHSVRVVSYGALEQSHGMQGIPLTVVSKKLPLLRRYARYFFALLHATMSGTVVYAQGLVRAGLPSLLACFIRRGILIVRVPGIYAWEQAHRAGRTRAGPDVWSPTFSPIDVWRHLLQRMVARFATGIVVPAECTRLILEGWGIGRENICKIRNAAPRGGHIPSEQEKAALKARLGLVGPVLVSGGRLVPAKGIDVLLAAIPGVLKEVHDATVVLVGEGPLRPQLVALADRLGIRSHIRFTGQIARAEVWSYLKAADAVVVPSIFEADSHFVLEAMAAGAVVVASDIAGNSERICHEVSGFLFPRGDVPALARLLGRVLESPSLRQRCAETAASVAEDCSPERVNDETSAALTYWGARIRAERVH